MVFVVTRNISNFSIGFPVLINIIAGDNIIQPIIMVAFIIIIVSKTIFQNAYY